MSNKRPELRSSVGIAEGTFSDVGSEAFETLSLGVYMYTPTTRGGHARYTRELSNALDQLRDEPRLRLGLITSRDSTAESGDGSVRVLAVLPPLRPRSTFRFRVQWALDRLTHYIRRELRFVWLASRERDLDLVHIQEFTYWLEWLAVRALHAGGKKAVCTVHNLRPHAYPSGIPHSWVNWLQHAAWREYDALIVHSADLATELKAMVGREGPPVHVVPHGVWTVDAPEAPLPVQRTDRERNRLLFFGNLRRNKGLHVLVEAMQRLPEFQLVVAGEPLDAGYLEQVREIARELPDDQIIWRTGYVAEEELSVLFQESDAVVLPYTGFSAQSGVLFDALAFGLPVIASDVGALGASVRAGEYGIVVEPEEAGALSSGIARLFEPHVYSRARAAAVAAGESESWDEAARRTAAVYLACFLELQ